MPVVVNWGMIAASRPLVLHHELMLVPAIVAPMPRLLNPVVGFGLLVARLVSLVVVRWRGRLPSTAVWCHIMAPHLLMMVMVIVIGLLVLLLMLLD